MKRMGSIFTVALVILILGVVTAFVWPNYDYCISQTRADAVVCMIRRNLHLGPHFNWSFNRHTIETVRASVTESDIPHLIDALGHERPAVRVAAGNILLELGNDTIEALHSAAQSANFDIRNAAQDALSTWKIRQAP